MSNRINLKELRDFAQDFGFEPPVTSNYVQDYTTCPRCGSETEPSMTLANVPSQNWYQCVRCNTYINTYIPQAHQASVHADSHRYVGNFGGYGTGKTTTSRQEIYKHIFLTPNANILVGAKITYQYEQTIKRDLENDLPKAFVAGVSAQKGYIDFINGARIMFRPLEEYDSLRSYNLSMFVIVEGSEVPADAYAQLKTRLRNENAIRNGGDWRKGIVESNPDAGYIRTEILLTSDSIKAYGEVYDKYSVMPERHDVFTSSHIASTSANKFLPATFISELVKNKPAWWVARYINSSFSYSEGLVYPVAPDAVVKAFDPPKHWRKIIASDYGLSDNFTYVLVALDEDEGVAYAYQEYVTNNKNIKKLSEKFHELTSDIPQGMMYCQPILDPKSGAKRDYNKKTLFEHFAEHDIYFKPGHVNLEARILRLNTYLESGRLKIMDNCTTLIWELENYKFPDKKLSGSRAGADKPIDKNNHCINPLEWIAMELPADPKKMQLGSYDRMGREVSQVRQRPVVAYDPLDMWGDRDMSDPTHEFDIFAALYNGGQMK